MSRVNVKPDELKALASDVGKLAAQSKEIKANLQLNYYSIQSNGQGINLSAISPLYNSLIQQMEHYGTLLHSAQDVVKKTETKFREADQQLSGVEITAWLSGTFFAGVKTGISFSRARIKEGKLSLDALIRFYYCKKKYGFKTIFDLDGRKGKGAFTLIAKNREDLVHVSKLLQLGKDDDALMKYIRNGLKFDDLKLTKSQIKKAKKTLFKLPEFKGYQDFQIDRRDNGLVKAIGKKGLSSFKSNYADGLKDTNPFKWKSAFKDLGKVGKTMKGLAVVGSALSVTNNVIEAQKDGWQAKDAANIVTDSAIDIGSAAAAASTGAVVGSFFLPPAGTVVGAGVGIGASFLMNHKFDFMGGESVVSGTKKAVKGLTSKIASVFW
ncbi:WXG100 family type VII secretion target [Fictibacillus sp. FJAT-27399]|uniref:WXG100 family type VII secretion target n=1 Tax=Fictibacillus sp. FJAT-27399 TaxID=1729689 RepID=UPI0007864E27|nr:WXG100 family type VII secretion target [Fictibacillus sp. FJAT-27399]